MLFTVLALLAAGEASAAQLFGRVIAVADGDTVTVLEDSHQQYTVRLAGIDAPERRQAYGERAKHHLASLLFGKSVIVVWDKRDRYGRIVGRVLARDCVGTACGYSIDAGLAQIRAGLAWHYKQYEKEQSAADRVRYAALEREARARREGLWKDPHAVPPWLYRRPSETGDQAVAGYVTSRGRTRTAE